MKYLLSCMIALFLISCNERKPKAENKQEPSTTPQQVSSTIGEGHMAAAIGDLNKDGLTDSVVVTQDTLDENWPYKLEIFFADGSGSYRQVLSSTTAIDAQKPNGADYGDVFDEIKITNGVLGLGVQLLRGHYEHKFRYQHDQFELIGFTTAFSDGRGTETDIDFNLSTGHYIKKNVSYETDKVLSTLDTLVHIAPLPNLASFAPYSYHEGEIDF